MQPLNEQVSGEEPMVFHSTKFRARALSGAAFSGLLAAVAAPAYGQATENESGGLKEIVVTAQHREELLRDVPIAVNAITADNLKNLGVADTNSLVQAVP